MKELLQEGHIDCPCWATGEFIQVPCPYHDGKDKFPKGAYLKSRPKIKLKGLRWFVKVFFERRDCWIGVYFKKGFAWDIYICPLPCCVIHIYQGVKF